MAEKWFPLQNFGCPTKACTHQMKSINWICDRDNSQILISEYGNMGCSSFQHVAPVSQWRFDCGNHGSHPVSKWHTTDLESLTFAITQAINLLGAGANWIAKLTLELGKQAFGGASGGSQQCYAKSDDI